VKGNERYLDLSRVDPRTGHFPTLAQRWQGRGRIAIWAR
jgi:hypothetical protein